ncbi:hypothetical protein CDV36_016265 [Fusarium kuroshium]|uniref:Uncharacterized protein n=1 Tax=Fusarium kuroshium TaxID=2010991 RepID=A0A3M2QVX4_9HYPO|nr:hypothetical protein CDV36_016265 [Fusarium kuroshium]
MTSKAVRERSAAEFAVENVQTRPENSSLVDTREFGPDEITSGDIFITLSREDSDLGIIDAEPAYYDEEPVDAYGAEEREDQTESGTPEVYVEVQADLLTEKRRQLSVATGPMRSVLPGVIKEVVLLGLPHVMTTLHNRLPGSEGSLRGFLPSCNCLTESQLLASAGVSSSLTQSRLDFHPPHLPSVYSTTTIYRHLPPYEGARTGPL